MKERGSENNISFVIFPKEWGIYIPYSGPGIELKESDLEFLELLREELSHKEGQIVEFKWDIKPLEINGTTRKLKRLWANNMIFKFAQQVHTLSNRPEYLRWWIWGDYESSRSVIDGNDTAAPVYISER